jgi:hypothetical protein
MNASQRLQNEAARKELEAKGLPLPLDYEGDEEYAPVIAADPPGYVILRHGRESLIPGPRYVARVNGRLKYYMKTICRSK